MSNTLKELYNQVICPLTPNERLRLATLILNDFTGENVTIIDESDAWTEEDQLEITTFSWQYAAQIFADNEEII